MKITYAFSMTTTAHCNNAGNVCTSSVSGHWQVTVSIDEFFPHVKHLQALCINREFTGSSSVIACWANKLAFVGFPFEKKNLNRLSIPVVPVAGFVEVMCSVMMTSCKLK